MHTLRSRRALWLLHVPADGRCARHFRMATRVGPPARSRSPVARFVAVGKRGHFKLLRLSVRQSLVNRESGQTTAEKGERLTRGFGLDLSRV